jgi:hypothetical protein
MAEAMGLGQVGGAGETRPDDQATRIRPASPHPATLRVADLPLKGGGKVERNDGGSLSSARHVTARLTPRIASSKIEHVRK